MKTRFLLGHRLFSLFCKSVMFVVPDNWYALLFITIPDCNDVRFFWTKQYQVSNFMCGSCTVSIKMLRKVVIFHFKKPLGQWSEMPGLCSSARKVDVGYRDRLHTGGATGLLTLWQDNSCRTAVNPPGAARFYGTSTMTAGWALLRTCEGRNCFWTKT